MFLASQGLPFRGRWVSTESEGTADELNSNSHQLLPLCYKDDPTILEFMERKTKKYTDHHIQDDLLNILVFSIATIINQSCYFLLRLIKCQIHLTKSKLLYAFDG